MFGSRTPPGRRPEAWPGGGAFESGPGYPGGAGFDGYRPGEGNRSALPRDFKNDGSPAWVTWGGAHVFEDPGGGAATLTSEPVELARIECETPGLIAGVARFQATGAGVLAAGQDVVLALRMGVGRATVPLERVFPKVAPVAAVEAQELPFTVPGRILIVEARVFAVAVARLPLRVECVIAPFGGFNPWMHP